MTEPHVWPHISDDFSPPPDEFEPPENDSITYLLVRLDGVPAGVFVFMPQNGVCWEVHTCLLPSLWGPGAAEAARQAARWVWRNSECRRIVTNVPAYNRLALRFAKAAGMTEYGRNPKSYMKNGILEDQILLGMSPPEE